MSKYKRKESYRPNQGEGNLSPSTSSVSHRACNPGRQGEERNPNRRSASIKRRGTFTHFLSKMHMVNAQRKQNVRQSLWEELYAHEKTDFSQGPSCYPNMDWISTHQNLFEGILPSCYSLHLRKALFCSYLRGSGLKTWGFLLNLRQPKSENPVRSTVFSCRLRIWRVIIHFSSTNDICYLLPPRQETLCSMSLTDTHFLAGHFVCPFFTAFQILWIRVEKLTLKNKVWFGSGYLQIRVHGSPLTTVRQGNKTCSVHVWHKEIFSRWPRDYELSAKAISLQMNVYVHICSHSPIFKWFCS